ncbi:MAG: hypothetical protein NT096_00130 [Proteobacteria bacterium]|nr:hypothetical protein [Pseudomonadota bacterium]
MPSYKVTCPKSKRHKRFSVTAHVVQEWQVDGNGEFVKVLNDCIEVAHRPDREDYFTCITCGTKAHIE